MKNPAGRCHDLSGMDFNSSIHKTVNGIEKSFQQTTGKDFDMDTPDQCYQCHTQDCSACHPVHEKTISMKECNHCHLETGEIDNSTLKDFQVMKYKGKYYPAYIQSVSAT